MTSSTWLRFLACLSLPTLALAACKPDEPAGDGGSETATETGDGDGDPGDGDGTPGDGDGDGGPGDGDGDGCTPGEIVCVDGTAQICSDDGTPTEEPCSDACVDGLGCVLCVPGSGNCESDTASICNEDGSAWEQPSYCDPLQGMACDAGTGTCTGACAEITGGFLGCDFYPTVTAAMQEIPGPYKFGVVVANGNDVGVDVCLTQGGGDTCMTTGFIGPNTVQVYELDEVPELRNPDVLQIVQPSVFVEDAAYRIRTTLPISVYQFNPHPDYVNNSADASLLFPVHAWGNEYFAVSRNHWTFGANFQFPGFYTIVASEQDTTVNLLPSSTGGVVAAGGGVGEDGTGQIIMHRGDVLQVHTWMADNPDPSNLPNPSDLTGTRIVADKPIQVIGGSKCTNVPFNETFCDRLEDSNLPLSLASTSYIVSAPVTPNSGGISNARRMVRIVATEDDTNISYNPAVMGAPTAIAYAGDYIELDATTTFQINGSKKVMVAEYMTGVGFGGGGDPSMAVAVPTERFLSEYLIVAPTNYEENWVNIIFDKDTVIQLNGNIIIDAIGAEQIGVSPWRVKRVQLSNAGDGTHHFVAQDGGLPFGLTVYGYSSFISYWYPGGLDLPAN